jgi:hypothetical protein
MFSVVYAVLARLASIPFTTVVIRQAFPNRVLMLHACLGAAAGIGVILLLYWSVKLLLVWLTSLANRRMQMVSERI